MSLDPTELYCAHARELERTVAGNITTSNENVQDACSFAWMQLVIHADAVENPVAWLYTVATREALKLHRRSRLTATPLEIEPGEALDVADPADQISGREELLDARQLMRDAGLSDRQIRLLALQAIGLSYTEIAEKTDDSTRTVERQLLRARRKLELVKPRG